MLTIVCGEDSPASRKYYQELKDEFKTKQYEVQNISPKNIIEQITKSDQTMSLFSTKIIFFTENLNSFFSKGSDKSIGELEELAKSKDIEIFDWEEDKSTRELKIAKLGKIKEFKPLKNIFQLLDSVYPGNKNNFIKLLGGLSEGLDEAFIFIMISRHVRALVLAKNKHFSSKVQPWQKSKLYNQAQLWTQDKLNGFYEGLFRIEQSVKTSSNAYGIKKSLDILAVHFL